jgi:cellulose synthase/poly-beta-1,6-N-acetylglucosamine synthase-like glycosyltransferase
VIATLFWSAFGATAYIYFGYPALLSTLARLRPRPVDEGDIEPRLTILIPAYNEQRHIAAKIENTLALDYPAGRLEVLVLSNGSTDRTNEIVAGWPDPRVRLIALERPGKIAALNAGVAEAGGDILVFTDADFLLDRHSLRALVRGFHDPTVGGVCGARRPGGVTGDATGRGEGMYARWDRWQKVRESRVGSVFAADGLLYAIRRELYVPPDDPAQADDIAISARIPLAGRRLLFAEGATAWEESSVEAGSEFRRKVRVTNHSVRALLNLRGALVTSGFYSVELLSHKLVRHFVPLFLVTMLATGIPLAARSAGYRFLLGGQLTIYALAAAGGLLRNRPLGRKRLFSVPWYFCFVNAAALVGLATMLRGHRKSAWERPAGVAVR